MKFVGTLKWRDEWENLKGHLQPWKVRPDEELSPAQRLVRNTFHFGTSVIREAEAIRDAAPGYIDEIKRHRMYPQGISFRKLQRNPKNADLKMLKRMNPSWPFRKNFDPDKWVFVFLHGYVDNTGADRVVFKLADLGYQIYLVRYPFMRSVPELGAEMLPILEEIAEREPGKSIVPIGHSLGGLIWDEILLCFPEVVPRYRMPLYIPLGSPHFGTLAAYFGIGQSVLDMRPGSDVVRAHRKMNFPDQLEIYPFVSRFDLLVVPVETALMKRGINYILSETGHIGQVSSERAVHAIEEIITCDPDVLRERATKRIFYPSSLTWMLSCLPAPWIKKMGVDVIHDYLGEGDEQAEFFVRVVRHEIALGLFPKLVREE